ncbi:MAG: hypothetical protein V3T24_11985 [Longimicrobiales bacterium]
MNKQTTHRRGWRRIAAWTTAVFVSLGALTVAFTFGWLADIRPNAVRDGISEQEEVRGRELLAELARSHGLDRWHSHESLQVEMSDTWFGPIGLAMNPWAVQSQEIRLGVQVGSWTTRMELMNGPNAGDVWGVQDMNAYFARGDGPAEFDPDPDISVAMPADFLAPTFQYFFELPLRIESASVVAWAGEAERDGQQYDLVYATWGSPEPQRHIDQYLIWINRETGRADRVEHTIRDLASSGMGAIVYSGHQERDGVHFPRRGEAVVVFPGGASASLHVMIWQEPRFDAVALSELRPDPERVARRK